MCKEHLRYNGSFVVDALQLQDSSVEASQVWHLQFRPTVALRHSVAA